ncbi:MAG: hypothetical protein U0Q16_33815 [Bryobacteraceae bacterium]
MRFLFRRRRPRSFKREAWRLYEPGLEAVKQRKHLLADIADAAGRVCGFEPRDEQILAALALLDGKLVEMQTGEGKTLAGAMAAAHCALRGDRVHLLAANDFLARRDALVSGDLYRELGLRSGFLSAAMGVEERRAAYANQIVYATVNEVAFDYLLDNAATDPGELIQPPLGRAIVDDAEAVLLDEARTSLALACGDTVPAEVAYRAAGIARWLREGTDYRIDPESREVTLTETGMARVEFELRCGHLHQPQNLGLFTAIADAVHAKVMLERGYSYVIRDGAVEFIGDYKDLPTARTRWPAGLQTAVETMEGLRLSRQGRILNAILVQNFVRLYANLSALSGCAATDADQFRALYGLTVIQIPPHNPVVRTDKPDLVFTNSLAKRVAIVQEVEHFHTSGRPVVVNTGSVEESEEISRLLTDRSIEHNVLHGGRPQPEAAVAAQAGSRGAVTVVTGHAARGIPMPLHEGAGGSGGLYVIGTGRHDVRRADMLTRARAGSGMPSESRFFVSLDDSLIVRFGLQPVLRHARAPGRAMEDVQWVIETQNQDIRAMLSNYERVLEDQRRLITTLRRAVLTGEARSLVERHARDHFYHLAHRYGEAQVREAERKLRLEKLDELWADYYAWLADFRAGVHWPSWGSRDPLRKFRAEAEETFGRMLRAHEEEVVAYFELDTLPESIPSSIDRRSLWTYALPEHAAGLIRERLHMLVRRKLATLGVLQP